jgi:hypothetical protein
MICPRCRQNIQEIEYGLCKECYTEIIKKENSENQFMIEKLKADKAELLEMLKQNKQYICELCKMNESFTCVCVRVARIDQLIEKMEK